MMYFLWFNGGGNWILLQTLPLNQSIISNTEVVCSLVQFFEPAIRPVYQQESFPLTRLQTVVNAMAEGNPVGFSTFTGFIWAEFML